MKKVLIIMACDLPVPAVKGGAVSTLIESILRVNEKEGKVSFHVFTIGDKESVSASRKYPKTTFINLYHHHWIAFFDKFFPKKQYIRKLYVIAKAISYLKRNDFDAVVLQNSGYLLKIFRNKKLLEKYKGKLYYHLHNDIPTNADKKVMKQCLFILISDYLRKRVIKLCGQEVKNRLITVKNGINIHKFSQQLTPIEKENLRRKLNIKPQQNVLIFTGRIVPEKGIKELLLALEAMNDNNIVLLVIGSTNFGASDCSLFEKEIQEKCEKMADRVRFTGFIHNDELWKYYQLADVAVLPSVWEEPAGLTMIEAVASGVPVVSTISGGIPEYISANCAILVKRDAKLIFSLAEAIRKILDHRKEWMQKIIAGREEVRNMYSEEAFYQRFINVLNIKGLDNTNKRI